jgi:hypothetical protein
MLGTTAGRRGVPRRNAGLIGGCWTRWMGGKGWPVAGGAMVVLRVILNAIGIFGLRRGGRGCVLRRLVSRRREAGERHTVDGVLVGAIIPVAFPRSRGDKGGCLNASGCVDVVDGGAVDG